MKSQKYISDESVVKRAKAAVRLELEKKAVMELPVAVFDRKTQTIYYKNSDGSTIETRKRLRKGRYSERIAKET